MVTGCESSGPVRLPPQPLKPYKLKVQVTHEHRESKQEDDRYDDEVLLK